MQMVGILALAIFVEGFISYIKQIFVTGKSISQNLADNWQMVLGIILGVAVALSCRADIFTAFGVIAIAPWVNYVMTGLVLCRGSNYVFEFFKLIRQWTTSLKGE